MEAVVALPEWAEVIERNPANRDAVPRPDPDDFIATHGAVDGGLLAGHRRRRPRPDGRRGRGFARPALVFRSGESDLHHPRSTSERVAAALPGARLVEPPWGDREWRERQDERNRGVTAGLFVRWHLLVPQLQAWADEVLG